MNIFQKIFVLTVLLFLPTVGFVQESNLIKSVNEQFDENYLDSLYEITRTTNFDTIRALNFLKLSIALELDGAKRYRDKSGVDYLNMAKNIAIGEKKIKDFIKLLDDVGVRNRRNGRFKTALRFHMAALRMTDSIEVSQTRSIVLNNIGVVYRRIDDYQNALYYHMEALRIADSLNDSRTKAMALNSIGNVYVALDKYDEALNYFKQSLSLEYDRKNKLGIAINLNNIGSVYQAKGNLKKAYEYYLISLDVNKEINSVKGIGICHADIGDVYYEQKEYEKALHQYTIAEKIFLQTNDKVYLANSYLQAGKVYIALKKYDKALKSLHKALDISNRIGKKVIAKEAYKWISVAYKEKGNYKLALEYFEQSNNLQDSINNIVIQKSIIRMQIKYDLESKENEIALLQQMQQINKLELRKQKTANLLMLVIIIFILVVMVFLFYLIYTRNRRNKLLEEKNKEIEKARAELKKYSEDLLVAKNQADKSSKAKSVFLANMSHEFRTPLNSVIGYTDLMYQSETDPVKQEQLKIIRSSSQSLLVLLNDILDLSKIEAGKLEIVYQPVNVIKTIDEVYQLFKLNTDKKGIKFTYSVQKGFPENIVFSEIRLRQILFNLVGNAVKFTEKGEVMIEVLFEDKGDGTVDLCIEIEDTGSGIEKDDLELIFKPFVQLNSNKNNHGTGLGLTITKRLVESMGGELKVNSEPGKGTVFNIKFSKINKVSRGVIHKLQHQQVKIYDKSNIKTLFICNNNEDCTREYTLLNTLTDSFVKVENDLLVAKSLMPESDLVVICSDKADFINNALRVLSHSSAVNGQRFIITTGKQSEINNGFAINFKVIGRSTEELKKLFNDMSFEITASKEFSGLGSCYEKMKDNQDFMLELQNELFPVFNLAVSSKLMGNIKEFSALLKQFGKKYQIISFAKFAESLDANIQKFEINEVERLLNYFQKNCFINQ